MFFFGNPRAGAFQAYGIWTIDGLLAYTPCPRGTSNGVPVSRSLKLSLLRAVPTDNLSPSKYGSLQGHRTAHVRFLEFCLLPYIRWPGFD